LETAKLKGHRKYNMAALVHLTCVVRQKNRFSCVVSRQFSVCSHLYAMSGKHIPANCAKYADNKVAGRATKRNRTMAQRVMNVAYRRVPFDERFTVTAKHTGPHIEGGSVDAAKRTALHSKFTHCGYKIFKINILSRGLELPRPSFFIKQVI